MSDVFLFLSPHYCSYLHENCGTHSCSALCWGKSGVAPPGEADLGAGSELWSSKPVAWAVMVVARRTQQRFLCVTYSPALFEAPAAPQGWENMSQPGRGKRFTVLVHRGIPSEGQKWFGSSLPFKSTSAHEGLWEIPAMKVNYKPLINQTFTVGWSGLAVWAPARELGGP